MTTERMIRDLEATKKSFEGKFVGTGEVNVVWMIEDIVKFIKTQEADAELGRAIRYLASNHISVPMQYMSDYITDETIEYIVKTAKKVVENC